LSIVNTPGVAGRERPAASELLTGIVLLVAVGLWASNDGGYAEVAWYPIAALLVALITALWIGGYPIVPADRMSLALCGSLAGYTIWSYASIGWAADRGIALTGANRGSVRRGGGRPDRVRRCDVLHGKGLFIPSGVRVP
jgi:hypothetical protein